MTFRVRWHKRALNRLTTLWTQADSATRKALTQASDAIDRQLAEDPYAQSESRPNGRRIGFSSPLAVYFRVESDGQTITVLQVHTFGKHSS
jgi:hypothetical protein